jgi:hypothetical protein
VFRWIEALVEELHVTVEAGDLGVETVGSGWSDAAAARPFDISL